MILLVDNYDSFVHNLARYLRRLGQESLVLRNDAIDVAGVRRLKPEAIVLSPGPCTPNEAGCSLDLVREFHKELPLLGVCLGHQAIAQAFGGRIIRAARPVHGQASVVTHDATGLFANLPSPLRVGRYHSLAVDPSSLPAELQVTAQTKSGTIMALAHRTLPVFGVQFHPESILTEHGYDLLVNFLRHAQVNSISPPPPITSERPTAPTDYLPPARPVTF